MTEQLSVAEKERRSTARLWSHVDRSDPDWCWEWTGQKLNSGYGDVRFKAVRWLAHRLLYTLLVAPIPPGLALDHLCRNRACVNPKHLEPVTNRENLLRGKGFAATNAARTHCVNGHLFDEENTYRRLDTGHRLCRTCRRLRMRKGYRRTT